MSSRCTVSCWRVVQVSPFYYAHAQRRTNDETWDKIHFQVELYLSCSFRLDFNLAKILLVRKIDSYNYNAGNLFMKLSEFAISTNEKVNAMPDKQNTETRQFQQIVKMTTTKTFFFSPLSKSERNQIDSKFCGWNKREKTDEIQNSIERKYYWIELQTELRLRRKFVCIFIFSKSRFVFDFGKEFHYRSILTN